MSGLHEERRDLTAMVCLMIEEVDEGMPERELVHHAAPKVAEISGEFVVRQRRDECVDLIVRLCTLMAELVKALVELLIQRPDPARPELPLLEHRASETPQPHA